MPSFKGQMWTFMIIVICLSVATAGYVIYWLYSMGQDSEITGVKDQPAEVIEYNYECLVTNCSYAHGSECPKAGNTCSIFSMEPLKPDAAPSRQEEKHHGDVSTNLRVSGKMEIMEEVFRNQLEGDNSKHKSDMEGINQKLDNLQYSARTELFSVAIENLQAETVPLMNDEVKDIQNEMKGMKEKQEQQEGNLRESLTQLVEKQGLKQALAIKNLQTETVPLMNVPSQVKDIQYEMKGMKEKQEQQEANLRESLTQIGLKQAQELQILTNQLKEVNSSINQFDLKVVICAFIILMVLLYQNKLGSGRTERRTDAGGSASISIGPTVPALHKLTVVTFTKEIYEQAQTALPQMLGRACPRPDGMKYRLLTGELDLSQIPSSHGYIVVIGYDARNSILEDMDGSMGNRKRLTVLGLQETKREVLVIYIENDPRKREPPADLLYNTHLGRPTSHPILRQLVDNQSFLSLYNWKYTQQQADHIRKWVSTL